MKILTKLKWQNSLKMKKPMKFIGFFVDFMINLNKFSVQIKFFSGSNFDISKLTDR